MIGLIALALLAFVALAALQSGNDSNSTLSDIEYDIEVEVKGLHCSMCVRNCERSLKKLDEVEEASVQLDEGMAFIKVKEGRTVTKEQVIEAIENAGFETGDFKRFPENNQTEQE